MKRSRWLLTTGLTFLTSALLGFAVSCGGKSEKNTGSDNSSTPPEQETVSTEAFEIKNGGFESGDLKNWTAEGEAFSALGVSNEATTDDGQENNKSGEYYFAKYAESAEGSLTSSLFKIGGSGFITFKLGGGMNVGLTYLSVVDEAERELFRFGNTAFQELNAEALIEYKADLSSAMGKEVKIKIVDNSKDNFGYMSFDDFVTYYETEPSEAFISAEDIKPLYVSAEATPSFIKNADFANGLDGWQTAGEEDCFAVEHISGGRLSNKSDYGAVGVLRSSPFTVSGTGVISYRLGMTAHPSKTYLSVKKCGTNEEVFRTHSDRWKISHGESTHLYYADLSKYKGEALYLEFVDNSREQWGAISLEAIDTVYEKLPASLKDETAFDIKYRLEDDPTYETMRETVDGVISGIEDETLRKTFKNTFYATLDGFTVNGTNYSGVLRYYENGTAFCYTGDIPAMWLRDSSAQVLQYLQFMKVDKDVRNTVRGLLLKQFELIRRDPYANAFNENGSVWERKFELDSLAYPLWLTKQYYDITGDGEIFNAFFLVTLDKILTTLENEREHKDSNYSIISEDRDKGVNEFKNCGLIWSGYRPSDDVCHYKFFIPGNMFVVSALEDIVSLLESVGLNGEIKDRAASLAASVRTAIETYGVYNHPKFGKMYAFEVDGSNADINSTDGKLFMDAANIPSLIAAPWLGYCDVDDQTYVNTRAFVLSDDNPYYYVGEYASGIGDPHDMVGSTDNPHKDVPVPWHMSIAMQGLTSTDKAEIERCVKYMTETTGGTFVMHEAFNANDPTDYSRDYFTWPCSLYAHLVLTKIFGVNLLNG
ncbi:MAG: glycoside hydrolase family 125 protein [Clostridia bacterium]|nr:glycoside hydrolase family 125 protein [Clostridia bacterium]